MKNVQKVVFFGTHEMAVPALETLDEQGIAPELIVTRPETDLAPNPMARNPPEPSPHLVKLWAKERDIPTVTSRRVAEPELRQRIAELAPDLLVVADYGRAIPIEVVKSAKRGGLQAHPSLLPKLRGSHALRAAISQGLKKTGVTIFLIDEDPWGGPILLSEEVEMEENETFGQLVPRIQELTRTLLADGLTKVDKSKNPKTRKQNPKTATKSPRITARHRRAPWQLEAKEVLDRWRAHAPPGLETSIKFRTVEIVRGSIMPWVNAPFGETGTYLGMRTSRMAVLCGRQTAFGIDEARIEGEDAVLNAADAAEALGIEVGDQFI